MARHLCTSRSASSTYKQTSGLLKEKKFRAFRMETRNFFVVGERSTGRFTGHREAVDSSLFVIKDVKYRIELRDRHQFGSLI
jgi:hypothetical protein